MEKGKAKKTPDYMKRSIDKYRADKKQVTLLFSADQWEKLKSIGMESGADIKRFLLEYIQNQ